MRKIKSTLFFFAMLASLCVSFPSQAFWFSGGYRPVLSADSSTFFIGQSISRAAGTAGFGYGGFGYGGFGYGGFGYGMGMGLSSLHRFSGYPHPSYAQYKRLQVQTERLMFTKMRTYYAPQNQETMTQNIRNEENEFQNFEKTTAPEINRLDQNSPEKKPQQSLISKDGLVTVRYY